MKQGTLPRLAWRRTHHPTEEATIPVAHRVPAAVGSAVPAATDFDDLPDPVTKDITFDDITAVDEPAAPAPAARRRLAYPGVSRDAIAQMRAEGRRYTPQALIPTTRLATVSLAQLARDVDETPVAELCAAAGLVYAKRGTAVTA